MESYDVIVVGGGMAGVSIGYELAADRRVLVIDMEATLAYHTTGRSAAMFLETYGSPVVRALAVASRGFLEDPPDEQLLTPLAMLYIGRVGRGPQITTLYEDVRALAPHVAVLEPNEAARIQPLLRADSVELALLEPGAMEIDVHALHQSYARGLRARGGAIAPRTHLVSAARSADTWTLSTASGEALSAPVVVDAAGAWADHVAEGFGAKRVGLRALRRTAFMVDAPPEARGPMIADVDDAFYVKPDVGQLLCSPADETPQEPADARPDELEIARAIDVINEVTRLNVRHVRSSWAGLRTFVADRNPVVGPDPSVEGLFWFAGQGGYGIQTAPALARTGAALLRGEPLPADIVARGLTAAPLAPDRPSLGPLREPDGGD
jgi:D-arginine dehydrogenase